MNRNDRLQALFMEMEMQRALLKSGAEDLRHSFVRRLVSRIRPWQMAGRMAGRALRHRSVWVGAASILMTLWRRSRAHRKDKSAQQ